MRLHPTSPGPSDFDHSRRGVVGTPDQFRWLYGVIEAMVILNLFDAPHKRFGDAALELAT